MTHHRKRQTGDGLSGPTRAVRRMVAVIIALTTIMMAVPAATPAAAQTEAGTGAIEVHVVECPAGYDGSTFYDDCHANGLEGANVSISGPSDASKATVGNAVRFPEIPVGSYTVSVNLPDTGQTYSSYCSLEGEGTRVAFSSGATNSGVLELAEGSAVICDFYVIPAGEADPVEGPESEDEQDEAQDPPANPASVAVDPLVCPPGIDAEGSFDTLASACATPAEDVNFTWGNEDGTILTTSIDESPNGLVAFADLDPGTYTLFSDIPLDVAQEALFCTADGGTMYEKEFSESGVTTFNDIDGETIACNWFIAPYDLSGDENDEDAGDDGAEDPEGDRGEETGGSLTVHLAACPQEYEGTAFYDTCHGDGIADQEFFLTGPEVETSATTTVPQEPGPGIVEFTSLPEGGYELAGGPPGDFGSVRLYCTLQPDGTDVETTVDSTRATFALGEGDDVLCDWYYTPDNAQGETPTPEPERAEILVTLLACDQGEKMAGATYGEFVDVCDEPRDEVTFTLGDPGAAPLSADTGVSGPGAVRFYDLLPADYTLTPSLPSDLSSAAVFCQLDGGDVYQKTLTSGATTFVNVDGEAITCEWFATQSAPAPPPSGPGGSVTVREFLCGDDASNISDWEQQCKAGSSGATFTVASADSAITLTSATNASGVATFSELPDGFYTVEQNEGIWCKARAERVDSKSRVIVENGENTTLFVYQCAEVTDLPSTGTGSAIGPMSEAAWWETASTTQQGMMGAGVFGGVVLVGWGATRRRAA